MSLRDALVPVLDRCFRTGGILSYHAVLESADVPSPAMHINVATLRRHLLYLRDHYTVIPLSELVERHVVGRSTDRCLSITFDDAYVGVERLAAPLLREIDLPATIFVAARPTQLRETFWWDEIEQARRAGPTSWAELLDALDLPAMSPLASSVESIRDHAIAHAAGWLTVPLSEPLSDLLHAMDVCALHRLSTDARFEFGCHTLTHPALPFLVEGEQEREIGDAYEWLENTLPRVVPIVAYPFGLYDDVTVRAAHRAGLSAGVTMQPRALDRHDSPFTLPRVGVSEDWSVSGIALRMNAALRPLFIARMGGRHPRLSAPEPESAT